MRLCVFEDALVGQLEPLTLTRAAFELRCGAATLFERQQRALPAMETGVLVRSGLAALCRIAHPELAVNDDDWLKAGPTVFVNARWLPPDEAIEDVETPRVGMAQGQTAYVILPQPALPECSVETIDSWATAWRQTLPQCRAGGAMMNYPWDLVEHNAAVLCRDAAWFGRANKLRNTDIPVLGERDNLLVHADALVEPLVVADTRNGPVLVDRGAVVQSFSRLEGPCYIGPETWVVGGKIRGAALGPCCRIGGEVEASIVQGYSNKYHDGFLGHSYLGEWVNLGAGTQVSDLRNDYGQIKVIVGGERIGTGLNKVGMFMGDHSKTGLGALINSGTVIGAFAGLLPSGSFAPPLVPSFCLVRYGQIQERTDLRQMFNTAATVMRRRGREWTGTHVDFYFNLYDETAAPRSKLIRDSERRRLRRSM
jgi:UDP-N-acetylglucosamine diphosphorylase/glucosamine-1-phosphate N-acetyltransferase